METSTCRLPFLNANRQRHYRPTEGEALAVAWSLENATMFVLRCQNLIITTDHQTLLSIFDNREISNIPNPIYVYLNRRPFVIHSQPSIAQVNSTEVQMLYPEIQHITHQILQYQHARMLQTSTLHIQTKKIKS